MPLHYQGQRKKLSLINEFNEALQAAMVRVGTEEQN